jgi:hypothetical protein
MEFVENEKMSERESIQNAKISTGVCYIWY